MKNGDVHCEWLTINWPQFKWALFYVYDTGYQVMTNSVQLAELGDPGQCLCKVYAYDNVRVAKDCRKNRTLGERAKKVSWTLGGNYVDSLYYVATPSSWGQFLQLYLLIHITHTLSACPWLKHFEVWEMQGSPWQVSLSSWETSLSLFQFHWLTHPPLVPHICVNKLTIIGSENGLSPIWRQAIIWTNAGLLSIGPLGTNFSEVLIKI